MSVHETQPAKTIPVNAFIFSFYYSSLAFLMVHALFTLGNTKLSYFFTLHEWVNKLFNSPTFNANAETSLVAISILITIAVLKLASKMKPPVQALLLWCSLWGFTLSIGSLSITEASTLRMRFWDIMHAENNTPLSVLSTTIFVLLLFTIIHLTKENLLNQYHYFIKKRLSESANQFLLYYLFIPIIMGFLVFPSVMIPRNFSTASILLSVLVVVIPALLLLKYKLNTEREKSIDPIECLSLPNSNNIWNIFIMIAVNLIIEKLA